MKPLLVRLTKEQYDFIHKQAVRETKAKGRPISMAEIVRFYIMWFKQQTK